jgi:uncharacterized protein
MRGSAMQHPNTISLGAVFDEPVAFDFVFLLSVEAIDREILVSLSPVRAAGEVSRIEKGFAFDARLAYGGELECSRCLAAYPFTVDDAFSIVLCPLAPQGEQEIALEKDDLDVSFYSDPVIPVAPIIEERIQMLLPMKPLCREDCKGLCPRCGEDWNVKGCACAAGPADARWEALKALKEKV